MKPGMVAAAASSQTVRAFKQVRPNGGQESSGGISDPSWPDNG